MNDLNFQDYEHIVFFTGAGMSAESGIPTFRGKGGIWEQYRPEEYACQKAFDERPEVVWEFHNMRRDIVVKTEPNQGHHIIAELEKTHPNVHVITQNIDGHHQKAGSQKVHELHGSLWKVRCDACGVIEDSFDAPITELKHSCGAYLRPHIVWFGDSLSSTILRQAVEQIYECDLFVSIGTSGVVWPAAGFPLEAKGQGATLVEINPQETELSKIFDITFRDGAGNTLSALMKNIK